MSNIAEAVAKLGLDTQGFDNNAERSFKRFAKQLEGVKDATDAAMRGAEALERMFVKSLAGVAVVGAANVLSDAMRDVGNKIGGAGDAAADAMSSMKGLASSMEEGYARAEKLNAAAVTVKKTLEEIKNSGPINQAVFAAFGGEGVLQNLEQSLREGSQAEVLGAAVNARNRARDTAGMTPEQIKNYDLQKQRADEISRIRQAGGDTAAPTIRALEEKYALEDAAKASEEARQAALGRISKDEAEARRQTDLEVGEIAKARESERNRAEAQRGLEEARRQVEEKKLQQKIEDQNLNTMQIAQAQDALVTAEENKRLIDKQVVETDAAASKIAGGIFGSARGAGQRMTSTEIGIQKAVERAYNQQTIKSANEYRDKVKADLGPGADNYAVNRELQRRQEEGARQRAKEPFDAAQQAKDQQQKILDYMQNVKDVLNELKAYAHVT
ncbi:hypothetical protein EBZ39_06965 [bacterium]|nr:hypothetical protein [bacterium]